MPSDATWGRNSCPSKEQTFSKASQVWNGGYPNHQMNWEQVLIYTCRSKQVSRGVWWGLRTFVGWKKLGWEPAFHLLRCKAPVFSWLSMGLLGLQLEWEEEFVAWPWRGCKGLCEDLHMWVCIYVSSPHAFTVGKNDNVVCCFGFLMLPARALFLCFWLNSNFFFGCSFPLFLPFSIVSCLPQAWLLSEKSQHKRFFWLSLGGNWCFVLNF